MTFTAHKIMNHSTYVVNISQSGAWSLRLKLPLALELYMGYLIFVMFFKRKDGFFERVRSQLAQMLNLDVPPNIMAISCAIGMFLSVSPYLGLHTYLAIAIPTFFRIPVLPTVVFAYINTPLTMPVVALLETKLGLFLLGRSFDDVDLNFAKDGFMSIFYAGKSVLIPFLLGAHTVSIIASIFTYLISYCIVKKYREVKRLRREAS